MEKSKKIHVRLISIGAAAVLLILMILAIQNIVRYQTCMADRQKSEFLRLVHAMRFGTEELLQDTPWSGCDQKRL